VSKIGGYIGKILEVNLSPLKIRERELDLTGAKSFLGGSGLACWLIYHLVSKETDPLSPQNPLIFMTGPLTGTAAPSCGRYVVCAKSPLTNIWGESNAGGYFGPKLKFAGYDGIIFTGKTDTPIYLAILNGKAEIKDARHLWGKNVYETQRLIAEEIGDRRVSIACIGPAGEKGVLYASVMNDGGRAAGRTGMGAVMGAKNLKAIAVMGWGKIPLAQEQDFKQVAKEAHKIVKGDLSTKTLHEWGTGGYVTLGQELGDMPNKYFTQGFFETGGINGVKMAETILTKRYRCYGCPIGCGRVIKVDSGKYASPETEGPEYETLAAFGSLILNDDLEAVAYANYLCNLYGLDTISCGSTIAFAIYLYEMGVITPKESQGMKLRWGDMDTVIKLIELIAQRKGLGNILAGGVKRLSRRYGMERQAAEVKGLEIPFHDPRAFFGMAVCYATSPRGACHLQGDIYEVDMGIEIPELGIIPDDRFNNKGKAIIAARIQDWRAVYNSLIMCHFCNLSPQMIIGLLTSATGWRFTIDELQRLGERIFNLKRAFNNKLGIKRKDDYLPPIILQPLNEGGTEGKIPDIHKQLREYYKHRGWDWRTGKPVKGKLKELGLLQLIDS